mmetsp:Transcript_5819/g.36104  ORF Transcript_5819/g.36104 Transcript_5819/m.36104 type:complete len:527 (-) Transcript_5819:541-2121(-)
MRLCRVREGAPERTRPQLWGFSGMLGLRAGRAARIWHGMLTLIMFVSLISMTGMLALLGVFSEVEKGTESTGSAQERSIRMKDTGRGGSIRATEFAKESHDGQHEQEVAAHQGNWPAGGTEGQFYIYQGEIIDSLTKGVLSCMPQFPDHQDSAEFWIHEALQVHPKRTLDPAKAELFYVPTYNCLSSMLWKHTPCNGTRHLERMKALGQFLRNSQFYRRNGGADHFLVCQSHYCPFRMLRREPGRLLAPGFLLMHEKNPVWSSGWCPYRIINIPYVSQRFERTNMLDERREYLVSFYGAMNRDWKVTWDDIVWNRTGIRVPTGSELRGRLNAIQHLERVDIGIVPGGAGFNFDEEEPAKKASLAGMYRRAMLSSTFCFHIKGDTPTSRRFFDAVAAGCIPVVISDGMDQNLAFPWRVQYKDATVRVPEDDWLKSPELVVERLRKLENDYRTIQTMREALFAARVHFDYREFGALQSAGRGGVLVNDILDEIFHRKKQCSPGVCCREWVRETDPVLQTLPYNYPKVG